MPGATIKKLFSRIRVVPCGRTERRTDGRTVMTALITAFCKFENAPKRIRDAKNKNQGMDTKFQWTNEGYIECEVMKLIGTFKMCKIFK